MKITATLVVEDPKKEVYTLFLPEVADGKTLRSEYSVTHKGKASTFVVSAQDSVAFRATVNGICKILSVNEKMKEIQ